MQARRNYKSIAITLLLGSTLSIAGFAALRTIENGAASLRFERMAHNSTSAIRRGIEDSLGELQAVATALTVFESIREDRFRKLSGPWLDFESGLRSMLWLPRVTGIQRSDFERAARSSDRTSFTISEVDPGGRRVRAGDRAEYFPVLYSEPPADSTIAPGCDMIVDSRFADLLARARETGKMSVELDRNESSGETQPPLLRVAVPVFKLREGTAIRDGEAIQLAGFVAGIIEIDAMIEAALAYVSPAGLDLFIYESRNQTAEPVFAHRSRTRKSGDHNPQLEPMPSNSNFQYKAKISAGNQDLYLLATAAPAFLAGQRRWMDWGILLMGLTATAVFAWSLRSTEERTIDLATANRKLEREIMERRTVEARLRHDSCHDALTNLPNRSSLMTRLERCIERSKRDPNHLFAVLFLDIDNFKLVNDSLGHRAGDELLVKIANRLDTCLRSLDTVAYVKEEATARLGGDEFVVLLDRVRARSDALFIAERIHEQLTQPFDLQGHSVIITASIGIAVSDSDYETGEDLLRDADTAMYRAKAKGKARHAVFDETMHAEALARLQLEQDLVRAVEDRQFFLVYQPIVALDTGAIAGFEALLRWHHPERGVLAPREFMKVAEELALVVPLGAWVLEEACRTLKSIQDDHDDAFISVNVGKRELENMNFVDNTRRTIQAAGVKAKQIHVEISEDALCDATVESLDGLKRVGVGLHMDNFGRGYSSIRNLQQLPLDIVDIDSSLIHTMESDRLYTSVLKAVVDLAHNMNLKVLAEGIEHDDQLATILALECDFAQGSHFCKPLASGDVASFLKAPVPWMKRVSS